MRGLMAVEKLTKVNYFAGRTNVEHPVVQKPCIEKVSG